MKKQNAQKEAFKAAAIRAIIELKKDNHYDAFQTKYVIEYIKQDALYIEDMPSKRSITRWLNEMAEERLIRKEKPSAGSSRWAAISAKKKRGELLRDAHDGPEDQGSLLRDEHDLPSEYRERNLINADDLRCKKCKSVFLGFDDEICPACGAEVDFDELQEEFLLALHEQGFEGVEDYRKAQSEKAPIKYRSPAAGTPKKESKKKAAAPKKQNKKAKIIKIINKDDRIPKEIIYQIWSDEKVIDAEFYHKLVGYRVKISTIKSWLSMWKNGRGYPRSAKK